MLRSAYEAFPSFRETSKPICLVPRFESQSDSRKNDAVFRKIRIIRNKSLSPPLGDSSTSPRTSGRHILFKYMQYIYLYVNLKY